MEFFGVRVHEHMVGQSQLELGQVQADGIKVNTQAGMVWMALVSMGTFVLSS